MKGNMPKMSVLMNESYPGPNFGCEPTVPIIVFNKMDLLKRAQGANGVEEKQHESRLHLQTCNILPVRAFLHLT